MHAFQHKLYIHATPSILLIIFCLVVLNAQPAAGLVSNINMNSHHVIFDNLGQISTGVTYINVAIPLNMSIAFKQIGLFEDFLDSIINSPTSDSTSSSAHDAINKQNLEILFKQITTYTRNRLWTLRKQLVSIDDLLPADSNFDQNNERHKRLVFLAPMIVCEVDRTWYQTNISETQTILSDIQEELDFYKHEYATLYNDTLPDLIPEYVDSVLNEIDVPTLNMHVDYLQRTRRDVKFLLNVIDQQNANFNVSAIYNPKVFQKTTTTTPAPTTPNKFKWFDDLYSTPPPHLKRKKSNSRHLSPSQIEQYRTSTVSPQPFTTISDTAAARSKLLQVPPHLRLLGITAIPDSNMAETTGSSTPVSTTPYTPIWHKFSNMESPVFLERNKRFVVETAFATGILGTFLGLFNSYEMEKIRASMTKIENSHNLLVQISKIQEHQIYGLEVGLAHLQDVFSLLLKNSPSLLYAKINDQLLALQDNIGNLKDTLQMLQLQKIIY